MKNIFDTKSMTQAMKDIFPELEAMRAESVNRFGYGDSWVVGISHLNTKENRKLNKLLIVKT